MKLKYSDAFYFVAVFISDKKKIRNLYILEAVLTTRM